MAIHDKSSPLNFPSTESTSQMNGATTSTTHFPLNESINVKSIDDVSSDSDSASDLVLDTEADLNGLGATNFVTSARPFSLSNSLRDATRYKFNLDNLTDRIPLRRLRGTKLPSTINHERAYHALNKASNMSSSSNLSENNTININEIDSDSHKANGDSSFEPISSSQHFPSNYSHRQQPSTAYRGHNFWSRFRKLRLPHFRKTVRTPPSRVILVGRSQPVRYTRNVISNAKYTIWTFLPKMLFNEFSSFFNLYFLLVALSQAIPALRIGFLSTYIAPLAFVLCISIGKEALDDITRRKRDTEANSELFTVLSFPFINGNIPSTHRFATSHYLPKESSAVRQVARNDSRLPADLKAEIDQGNIDINVKSSRNLRVGDVLLLGKNQRVPADTVILKCVSPDDKSSDSQKVDKNIQHAQSSGLINLFSDENDGDENHKSLTSHDDLKKRQSSPDTFIRTDQLDGETDWKLRQASPISQSLPLHEFANLKILANHPRADFYSFVGRAVYTKSQSEANWSQYSGTPDEDEGLVREVEGELEEQVTALTVENSMWANTVVASAGLVYAVVVYTGKETRTALSTSKSRFKTSLYESQLNVMSMILCGLTLGLSIALVAINGFEEEIASGSLGSTRNWWVAVVRYLILFSTIVPVSLRVNVDMAKSVYTWLIEHDKCIPGTKVRSSSIAEELGCIEYLLCDKTGTLTMNEMELKKIHIGSMSYANDTMDEVAAYIKQGFGNCEKAGEGNRMRRDIASKIQDLVVTLAICHNVTPTGEIEGNHGDGQTYQASSPDEIAIVRWCEQVGLRLAYRDRDRMRLKSVDSNEEVIEVQVLRIFPFTSERKRMGIIARVKRVGKVNTEAPVFKFSGNHYKGESKVNDNNSGIWFLLKGADNVMQNYVRKSDWLDEETGNMAREGLRTLVIGGRHLTESEYEEFSRKYAYACATLDENRDSKSQEVITKHLERDLELLGVTGVEDHLQEKVKWSIEMLRNAGIKIWMLTGDKIETARCVGLNCRLIRRNTNIKVIENIQISNPHTALEEIDNIVKSINSAASYSNLIIDGASLNLLLSHNPSTFIETLTKPPAVIFSRCSPDQKAEITNLLRRHLGSSTLTSSLCRVACIGDGGNDVSMIRNADVSFGILGKEGCQASLASDISLTKFHHVTRLILWHGRNFYRCSAKLALAIIHRGIIFSFCQAIYSLILSFTNSSRLPPPASALFPNWLLVGYATLYTMFPIFNLLLDRDVTSLVSLQYPELYADSRLISALSPSILLTYILLAFYQSFIIQLGCHLSLYLLTSAPLSSTLATLYNTAIAYTALLLCQYATLAIHFISTWHYSMFLSFLASAVFYFLSWPYLVSAGYFSDPPWALPAFSLSTTLPLIFIARLLTILLLTVLPLISFKLFARLYRPTRHQKILRASPPTTTSSIL